MWRALLIVTLVQVLAFCIFWRRLRARRTRIVLIAVFVAANLPWWLFYSSVAKEGIPSLSWATALVLRLFMTWQVGVFLWLILAAALGILVLLLVRLPLLVVSWRRGKLGKEIPQSTERREFLVRAMRGAAWGAVLGGTAWGLVRTELAPRVVRYNLPVMDLPKSLDGVTIAHLTDLHIGFSTSPRLIAAAIALAGELRPDLVVITGDIIDQRPSFSQALVSHLDHLDHVPLGVYGIIGNHDVYTGADQVEQALSSGGINMLRNKHHSFRDEGLPLALVGVDDPGRNWSGSGGRVNLGEAMDGMSDDAFPILLAHRPTGFEQAREAGIPVTLCGHTHGGQFGLPGGPNLADPFYDFTHGLHRKGGKLVHVSAGIGSVGLPFRLGVPAEIALLRLSAASARAPSLPESGRSGLT